MKFLILTSLLYSCADRSMQQSDVRSAAETLKKAEALFNKRCLGREVLSGCQIIQYRKVDGWLHTELMMPYKPKTIPENAHAETGGDGKVYWVWEDWASLRLARNPVKDHP